MLERLPSPPCERFQSPMGGVAGAKPDTAVAGHPAAAVTKPQRPLKGILQQPVATKSSGPPAASLAKCAGVPPATQQQPVGEYRQCLWSNNRDRIRCRPEEPLELRGATVPHLLDQNTQRPSMRCHKDVWTRSLRGFHTYPWWCQGTTSAAAAQHLGSDSRDGFVPQQSPPPPPRMEPLLLRHSGLLPQEKNGPERCPLLRRRPLHAAPQHAFHRVPRTRDPGGKPTAHKRRKIATLHPDLPPVETENGRGERKQWKLFSRATATETPSIFR
jgi:hypothetical protein